MRLKSIAATISGLAMLLAFASVISFWLKDDVPPRDQDVIEFYRVHGADLEKLRQMVAADMPASSSMSFDNISDGFPSSRRIEYKNLLFSMQQLRIGANYDGSVRFIVASNSHAISPGWAKGLEFIPNGAKLVGIERSNLADAEKLPEGLYLHKISANWFIFFQRDE